jgi:hypothetical protein
MPVEVSEQMVALRLGQLRHLALKALHNGLELLQVAPAPCIFRCAGDIRTTTSAARRSVVVVGWTFRYTPLMALE